MAYHVKLSELANMPAADSDRVLAELVRSAKTSRNSQRAVLDARIKEFEIRHEMTSAVMRGRLANGSLKETSEIAKWLLTIGARDNRGQKGR